MRTILHNTPSVFPMTRRFTFTGKERDEETGFSYFGARYYDSDLSGLFLSVDPMADKYPGLSPYAYCAWNPLKLVDPDGWEIDVSALYAKNSDGSYKYSSLVKAFDFFAKTKWGIKELGKYAKAGQTIAGHTYSEDGEYHKKGIDISFGGEVSRRAHSGDSKICKKGGSVGIAINISDVNDVESEIQSICHEVFIHARQTSKDYSDDFKINHSYLPGTLKDYLNNRGCTNGALYHAEHAFFAWNDDEARNECTSIMKQFNPNKSMNEITNAFNKGLGKTIKMRNR